MVRGVSNSISYIVLLGISLILIAYSLNVFLDFQSNIREPMNASMHAAEKASDEFVKSISKASLSGGIFLLEPNVSMNFSSSLKLGIEEFPPYSIGHTALVQFSILNLGSGLLVAENVSARVARGNETVYSKEFPDIAVGYRVVRDIAFTPEQEGEYVIHVEAGGEKSEKSILVKNYASEGGLISGERNFTLLDFSERIFSYELKDRRFDASGSGRYWNISIPAGFYQDSFEFLDFQKNDSLESVAGQFIHLDDSYFNISEGLNSLSFSEELDIAIGKEADFLDLLIASQCEGGVNVSVVYPQKTSSLRLVYGEDICRLDSACGAPGLVIESGSGGYLGLQVVTIELEGPVERISVSPDCGMLLSGLSIRNRTWQGYGNASSALLFVERTPLQQINGEVMESREKDGFEVYDITGLVSEGVREFSIETDEDVSKPYLVYTEILDFSQENYSIPGKIVEGSVLLDVDIPYRKEVLDRSVSFSSDEGKYGTRQKNWNFGSVFDEAPEFLVGVIGKNISAQYDTYYPGANVWENINGQRMLQDLVGGDVRFWRAFVLDGLDEKLSFGFGYSNNYGSASFNARADLSAYFGAVELERVGHGISRGCTDCEVQMSGSMETLERSFNFTVPPNVIDAYVLVNSDLPNRDCYLFSSYPSSSFSLEFLGASYPAKGYQATGCGWCCYGVHKAEAHKYVIGALLPLQQIIAKARLVTDSVSYYNEYPHTGGSGEIVFVKRKPVRMDGLEFYGNARIPLNSSFMFRGTGKVSGVLEARYIRKAESFVDVSTFRSALLVLEPETPVEGLEVYVNGRKVRNASLLTLPEKLDISLELVPAAGNMLDISGKSGFLEWKILLD